MRAHTLIAITSAPAVLLLAASALLRRRSRRARDERSTVMLRSADLSTADAKGSDWWFGLLSPLLLVASAATLLQRRWNVLPERFPIHWGINGQPDHWVRRTATSVFGGLLFDVALLVGFGLMGELIGRFSPGHEGRSKMVRTARTILIASSWFLTTLICVVSLLPLSHDPTRLVPLITIGATVFSLGIVAFTVFRAIRMERIMLASQNSTDGRYWRAGLFYFNPGDSAVMVPKRNGFGYTLNFGRPVCWLILAAILLGPLLLPLLLRHSR